MNNKYYYQHLIIWLVKMEDKKIKLTIRQNTGSQFEVEVPIKSSVKELKEACADKAGIPTEEQRLIFKGILFPRSIF